MPTPADLVVNLFADGSACGHLPCSPRGGFFQTQPGLSFDAAAWHLLYIDYQPKETPEITLCLDGSALATDQLEGLLPSLVDGLEPTSRPLRARVSANREMGAIEDQRVAVDWFAVQGLGVALFADGFESGDTRRWSPGAP